MLPAGFLGDYCYSCLPAGAKTVALQADCHCLLPPPLPLYMPAAQHCSHCSIGAPLLLPPSATLGMLQLCPQLLKQGLLLLCWGCMPAALRSSCGKRRRTHTAAAAAPGAPSWIAGQAVGHSCAHRAQQHSKHTLVLYLLRDCLS